MYLFVETILYPTLKLLDPNPLWSQVGPVKTSSVKRVTDLLLCLSDPEEAADGGPDVSELPTDMPAPKLVI